MSQSQRIQEATAAQARRQAADLRKAAAATEREGRAAEARLQQLAAELAAAQEAVAAAGQQSVALQKQGAGVRVEIQVVGREKYKVGGYEGRDFVWSKERAVEGGSSAAHHLPSPAERCSCRCCCCPSAQC